MTIFRLTTVVLSCALLCGCSGSFAVRSGTQAAPATSATSAGSSITGNSSGLRANISSGSGPLFSVVILGVMIADGMDYVRGTGRWTRVAPPMAADRKVNLQDCTRPIEYSIGNVSCQ